MKNVVPGFTASFGKKNPPNPDLNYNAHLLKQAKGLVESGTFAHYFKKSFLVMMEVISYSIALFLLAAGVYLFFEVKFLFDTITSSTRIMELFSEKEINMTSLNFIKTGIYLLLFIPFVISIYWARTYTKSRRRIDLIKKVEIIIDEVCTNITAIKN
jgi:hypothetical protein